MVRLPRPIQGGGGYALEAVAPPAEGAAAVVEAVVVVISEQRKQRRFQEQTLSMARQHQSKAQWGVKNPKSWR